MNDDFEKRLQQVAPREIPSPWRDEILTAAQTAQSARHPSPATHPGLLTTLIQQLLTLTRPHRAAWAGLATVWLVIVSLNLAARDHSTTVATDRMTAPSPEAIAAWRQQRRELASLAEPNQSREIEAPKPRLPQPRSNRRTETYAA